MDIPSVSELHRVIDEMEPRLGQIGEAHASERAIPGGWSRKQILGHLIDSASNNHQRFVRALLDREVHLANYDQEGWVRVHAYQELDWRRLVSFWAAYNRLLWEVLERMPPDRLSIPCHIGDDPPAPLRKIVDGYVDHLKHHLEQIVDGITGPAR